MCRYFCASGPCDANRVRGAECPTCGEVSEFTERVLIIKLGALGDVVRTASILPHVVERHDKPRITWLTAAGAAPLAELFDGVDEVVVADALGVARVATGAWDCVYSLSNDPESAALATLAAAKRPVIGYAMEGGGVRPTNAAAEGWLQLASFNRLKQANQRTYQEWMGAIIGCERPLPPPRLRLPHAAVEAARSRISGVAAGRRIGVNLGSADRWPKKMLEAKQIADLAAALVRAADVEVFLLGGAAEAGKGREIVDMLADAPKVSLVLTADSVVEFAALVAQCDALITGDTLALHVATAFAIPTVALFGPTSPAEMPSFEGLVVKTWAPGLSCLTCYSDCDKVDNCMSLLDLRQVAELAIRQLDFAPARAGPLEGAPV